MLPIQYSSVFHVTLTRHYRFPTDANIFSPLTVQTVHGTHPGPCSILNWCRFPDVNRHETKTDPSHLVLRLSISESTLPIPYMSSWYSYRHILLY
jgi:hypothetical protein